MQKKKKKKKVQMNRILCLPKMANSEPNRQITQLFRQFDATLFMLELLC
jgi:hypothetical protein